MDSVSRVVVADTSMKEKGEVVMERLIKGAVIKGAVGINGKSVGFSTMPKNRGRDKMVSSNKVDKYRIKSFNTILRMLNLLDFWTGDPLQLISLIKRGDSMFISEHLIDEFLSYLKFPEPEKYLKGSSLWKYFLCSARKRCRIERARRQRVKGRNRKCIDMVIREAKKITVGDF